jgi:hypothetical protein
MRLRLLLVAIGASLLAGCATSAPSPSSSPSHSVELATGQAFTLPVNGWADGLAPKLSVVQQVTAQQPDGSTIAFQAVLALTPQQTRLTILDDLGRRAATITWGPDVITIDRAAWLPQAVDLRRVLVDMMLVYWPEPALRASMPSAWVLQGTATGRSITDASSGAEVITTTTPPRDPWQGVATLQQHHSHYSLTIQSQRLEP